MLSKLGSRTAKCQFGLLQTFACHKKSCTRLASTVSTTAHDEPLEHKKGEDLDLQSLSENSPVLEDEHQSVFPALSDVRPEELVGYVPFGVKSYFVERSATGNLPVYSDFKRGGKVVTEIRKIHGDPVQLRNDLQARLTHIPKDSFRVMMQAKKIVIEGEVVKQVKNILSSTF